MSFARPFTLLVVSALACSTLRLTAQGVLSAQAFSTPAEASVAGPAFSSSTAPAADLPEAPTAGVEDAQATASSPRPGTGEIVPKNRIGIMPGQSAQPLSARDKVTFGLVHAFNPVNIFVWTISSAFSQGIDSAPHFGQGWGPYAQRYGSTGARSALQTLTTDAVFAPLFHDDPRYYILGRDHRLFNRTIYAVTRTVITRGDSGQNRPNLALLAGYAVTAGATNSFYPQVDRTGKQTAETFGASLGGQAGFFLYKEFLDDALRIAHLRK